MSVQSPAMNVRTESASQTATEAVLSSIAALESQGFTRPRSLSPDAYLAALAELDPAWTTDLATLGSAYAGLRFGGKESDIYLSSIVDACRRVVDLTQALHKSDELDSMRNAWRMRFSMLSEAVEVTPLSEEMKSIGSAAIGADFDGTERPALEQRTDSRPRVRRTSMRSIDLSWLRLLGPEGLSRRIRGATVSLRDVATAMALSAALASAGTYYLPEFVRGIRGMAGSDSNVIVTADAPIAVVSPAPAAFASSEPADPMWPRLVPSTHSHANQFNQIIAGSLSDLAEFYRGVGRPERAAAIYSYVADERPDDLVAQLEYADYLLNPDNPQHRDPDRACVHAERAYALDSSDPRSVETLAAALFATGNVARAVALQQEWLDRERESDIVLNAEERPATNRSAS